MLEESLGNSSEVDLFEPFVSTDTGSNGFTYLFRHKGGLKWQPLHGSLNPRTVGFARLASIMQTHVSSLL
jgi:hypothetical protein